jgi:hypothetical protein
MNTNGLANHNAWFTVSNSAASNEVWELLDLTQTNAFFEPVYP